MSYEAKVREKIRRQNEIERAQERIEEEKNPTKTTILKQQRENLRRRAELQEEEAKKKQEVLDAIKNMATEDENIAGLAELGKFFAENPTMKNEVMTYLGGFAPIVQGRADKFQISYERKGEGEVQRIMRWFRYGSEVVPVEFSPSMENVKKKDGT